MSRKGKNVLQAALQEDVAPPGPGQAIVRALGSRGGNLVEVERPDGATHLVVLPSRFHKRLWVKRGGYLIIDVPTAEDGGGGGSAEDAAAAGTTTTAVGKVAGVIAAVLYDPDVRRLRALRGVWPPEFAADGSGGGRGGEDAPAAVAAPAQQPGSPSSSDDSGLPPLEANPNVRRYGHDPFSEEEEEEEEDWADE